MRNITLFGLALLLGAPFLLGNTLTDVPVSYEVPAIAHGQDWDYCLAPNVEEPKQQALSLDEITTLVPIIRIAYGQFGGGHAGSHLQRSASYLPTIIGILIGAALLMAGYDLIPRAQERVLRLQSLHLRKDLLS